MLIYHDGLPGSGKTYEAMVKHVLPALKAGRVVYARVDGLDYDKIATVLELSIDVVKNLLVHVEPEQVAKIHDVVVLDNSLVVIDELQNYWPANRAKLSDDLTRFVSEHRHRGIDILAMGQDFRDIHALFKRRIDRKISFMNLDVLGAARRYKWHLYKQVGEKFKQVSSGVEKYDAQYFGIYKSHVSEDVNTENYKNKRFVVWNDGLFRVAMVFVVLVLLFVPYYLWSLFDPETSALLSDSVRHQSSAPAPVVHPVQPSAVLPVSAPVAVTPVAVKEDVKDKVPDLERDYIYKMSLAYRVRLAAVLLSGDKVYVAVEFRDSSYRVQERIDHETLLALGWQVVMMNNRLVRLYKQGFPELVATTWPLDPFTRISDEQTKAIRESGESAKPKPEPEFSTHAQPLIVRTPSSYAPAPMGHLPMR